MASRVTKLTVDKTESKTCPQEQGRASCDERRVSLITFVIINIYALKSRTNGYMEQTLTELKE